MNLINQMLFKLLIIHDIFKNFILYISALILELNNWLLNNFFAVKYISTIESEPISAAAKRQPNSL